MNNQFELGTPLNIQWHFKRPDGENYSLNGQQPTLYCINARGRFLVPSVVMNAEGGYLGFTLTPEMQTSTGEYSFLLQLRQNNARVNDIIYRDAVTLMRGRTAVSTQEAGEGNMTPNSAVPGAASTPTIQLFTVGEFNLYTPTAPVGGADGYWYFNGQRIKNEFEEDIASYFSLKFTREGENRGRITIYEGNADLDVEPVVVDTFDAVKVALDTVDYEMNPDNDGEEQGDHESWAHKVEVEWQSNENTRQVNESTRQSNEGIRQSQESTRQNQESTRTSNENSRISAETARDSAESTRTSNENSRNSAENTRGTAETTRQSNETTRQNNESSRDTAETARDTAETARQKAEGQLGTTDPDYSTSRIKNELDRINNEDQRQQAEYHREQGKLASTVIEYAVGSSSTTPPVSGWDDEIPSVSAGQYLWARTTMIYGDGSTKKVYVLSKMPDAETVALNVNDLNSHSAAYDDADDARGAVDSSFRKPGLNITYLMSTGEDTSMWVTEQFMGDDVDDWSDASKWQVTGPVSVSQNTLTGKTQLEIGGNAELTVDKIPETNSTNLIESGGVLSANYRNNIGCIIVPNKLISLSQDGTSITVSNNSDYDLLAIKIPHNAHDLLIDFGDLDEYPARFFSFKDDTLSGLIADNFIGFTVFANNVYIPLKFNEKIVYLVLTKEWQLNYDSIAVKYKYIDSYSVISNTDITSSIKKEEEDEKYISETGQKVSASSCKLVYLYTYGGEIIHFTTTINGSAVISCYNGVTYTPIIKSQTSNLENREYIYVSQGGVIVLSGRSNDFQYSVYSSNVRPFYKDSFNVANFAWAGSYIIPYKVISLYQGSVTITGSGSYDVLVINVPIGAKSYKIKGLASGTRIHYFSDRFKGNISSSTWIGYVTGINEEIIIPLGVKSIAVDITKSDFTDGNYDAIQFEFSDSVRSVVDYINISSVTPSVYKTENNYYITSAGGKASSSTSKLVYLNVVAGYIINFTTLINASSVISEYDEQSDTFTPLVDSGTGNTTAKLYTWKARKNGIICLCGRYTDFEYAVNGTVLSDIFEEFTGSNIDASSLPDYYYPYIDNRTSEIMNNSLLSGLSTMFGFVTDVHVPHNYGRSGKLFAYIMERTPLRKVFFGGDTLPQSIMWYDKDMPLVDGISKAIITWDNIISPVREFGRLYNVRGNHDYSLEFTSRWVSGKSYQVGDYVVKYADDVYRVFQCNTANSDVDWTASKWTLTEYTAGYNVPNAGVTNSMMSDNNLTDTFMSNGHNYGYLDDDMAKVRYVIIDTSDGNNTFSGESNVGQGISQEQWQWLYNHAFITVQSGYKIVIVAHIPIQENCSKNDDYVTNASAVNLRKFLKAVQTRDDVTINGDEYDFASLPEDNMVLLYYCGHVHRDLLTFSDNYWCVSVAGDIWTNEPNDTALGGIFGFSYPARPHSIYEQAIDVVNVDVANGVTKAFRIGIGFDRILHHQPVTVGIGSTVEISSSLSGIVQWAAYDAVGKVRPVTTPPSYTSNIASVTSGVVTGLSAGESVVAAYSEDENCIELWGVTVG